MPAVAEALGVGRWKGPRPSREVEVWARTDEWWVQMSLAKGPEGELLDGDISH